MYYSFMACIGVLLLSADCGSWWLHSGWGQVSIVRPEQLCSQLHAARRLSETVISAVMTASTANPPVSQ